MSDGLTRWVTTASAYDDGTVMVRAHPKDDPASPLILCYPVLELLGEQLTARHNEQVEMARALLAHRPSMTPAEVEAALTRMAIRVGVAVAADLGPRKVWAWLWRRVTPRKRR
jgi:hypothetical protein